MTRHFLQFPSKKGEKEGSWEYLKHNPYLKVNTSANVKEEMKTRKEGMKSYE